MHLGVAECGAAFTVPYFLVVNIRHGHIVVRGVGTIVETDDVHCVIQIFICPHIRDDIQRLVLIGSDDADTVVGFFCLRGEVFREFCLVLDPVCKPFDEIIVRATCLIGVRVDEVNHVAVFLVGVEDGLFVPFVHGLISCACAVAVPVFTYPVGHAPSEDAHFDIRVDFLGVRCELESGIPGSVCFFVLGAHRTG